MKKSSKIVMAVAFSVLGGPAAAGGIIVYDADGKVSAETPKFVDEAGKVVAHQKIAGRYYLSKTVHTAAVSYNAPKSNYYVGTNSLGAQVRIVKTRLGTGTDCEMWKDGDTSLLVPGVLTVHRQGKPSMIMMDQMFTSPRGYWAPRSGYDHHTIVYKAGVPVYVDRRGSVTDATWNAGGNFTKEALDVACANPIIRPIEQMTGPNAVFKDVVPVPQDVWVLAPYRS